MKRWNIVLALMLLLNSVDAQATVGIDKLITAIENNTQISQQNAKIIQDTYGKLDDLMMQYTPRIIYGVSMFLLLIYLVILFFDRVRQKRNKKTYEQYIKELEDKQKQMIEDTNKKITELNNKLTPFMTMLNSYKLEDKKEKKQHKYFGFWFGCITTMILFYILKILGVQ